MEKRSLKCIKLGVQYRDSEQHVTATCCAVHLMLPCCLTDDSSHFVTACHLSADVDCGYVVIAL